MSVIGLRVGPFEILEPASVPEEGAWYRARRSGLTRRQPAEVLLCLLPPDAPPEQRAALQRRFEALKQLDDPRIPEAVAYYEGTGALALAASEGHTLADLVDARRAEAVDVTPATLLDLALEVAECLQRVHHRGRVHGHLSPDRVVLGLDGRVWIWGFGLGPLHPADPLWCPPERARGEPPGPATDQWSLGALITGLATGRVPWLGDDPLALARAAQIDALVDPLERQWPALGRALRRMLDPRPGNRFPSMNPVRQELLALARKAPGTSSRRELASSLIRADFVETAPFAPDRDDEPVEVLVVAEATDPGGAKADGDPGAPAGARADEGATPDPTPWPEPRPRRPSGAAEPDVALVRDPPEEPVWRAAAALPEEPIPVVRPKLRGDVPVARVSTDAAELPRPEARDAVARPDGGRPAEAAQRPVAPAAPDVAGAPQAPRGAAAVPAAAQDPARARSGAQDERDAPAAPQDPADAPAAARNDDVVQADAGDGPEGPAAGEDRSPASAAGEDQADVPAAREDRSPATVATADEAAIASAARDEADAPAATQDQADVPAAGEPDVSAAREDEPVIPAAALGAADHASAARDGAEDPAAALDAADVPAAARDGADIPAATRGEAHGPAAALGARDVPAAAEGEPPPAAAQDEADAPATGEDALRRAAAAQDEAALASAARGEADAPAAAQDDADVQADAPAAAQDDADAPEAPEGEAGVPAAHGDELDVRSAARDPADGAAAAQGVGAAAGQDAGSEPSEAGATPTLAPVTDADEDFEPGGDDGFTVAPLEFDDAPDPAPAPPPATGAPPSVAVRAAPLLVGVMMLLMLVWLLVRMS